MNSEKIKTVVIFVLIAVVIALGVYSFFGKDGFKNTETSAQFINDIYHLQSSLSYYLGSTYSDTFGIYTKVEILSGKATNKDGEVIEIKDNDDKNLPSIIETEDKLELNDEVFYKLSIDGIKELFEIDLSKYSDVVWYIQEDGVIKVSIETEPDWWQTEFESLKVGK
ncbi:MAG: hypothetical protein Q4D02_06755 [Clostridia bacterium]|nr:hypothetical protein [Clostridia bacterium]